MAQTYFAVLTEIGEAKVANATALGTTLQLTHMAVGDGSGAATIPDRKQKSLIHENRRALLNMLEIDPLNPSQIIAEQIIPEDVGGWWIREMGLYDKDGNLCAVCNCPDTYKPVMSSGSGKVQKLRMILIVSSANSIELKIDPSIVLASRDYVDQALTVHAKADDPHPQYAKDSDLAAHLDALDPHPKYTTEFEVAVIVDGRNAVAGYAKKAEANAWSKGQAGAVAPLSATTGQVTLDLSQSNNYEGTLTGNIVLANPSSMPVGQSGVIRIVQGATPSTIAYGSVWKAASGALPSLTAVPGAVDLLGYYVESATRIIVVIQGDVK